MPLPASSAAMSAAAMLWLVIVPASVSNAAPPKPSIEKVKHVGKHIDRRIAQVWKQNGLRPAPPVDDAGFLRRVSLDLIGRIPTVAETRAFLREPRPDRRAQLVDRLLASPEFARHWATVLRRMWIPQTDAQQFARLITPYENWLSRRLRERTAFDVLVRQQLNLPLGRMAVPIDPDGPGLGSSAFVAVSELKPENLAANTSRAFLGINIDCAQCHNHPFARWTREQFWQTAAFFARPRSSGDTENAPLSIAVGDTTATVSPKLLTGAELNWPKRVGVETGRRLLTDWITARANPYFSRNAVNRIWAQFFGIGFVEPLDDLSGAVPPSHPKLFSELSRDFSESGFDIRRLVRGIVLSRVYQLASAPGSEAADTNEPAAFSRMPVRALTGEQLYDSLRTAGGLPLEATGDRSRYRRNARQEFASRFLVPRPIEGQRSLVQALAIMNGPLASRVTSRTDSPLLKAVGGAPFLSDTERIETLYLAALCRKPNADESLAMTKYLKASLNRTGALSDILWALLNSSEFHSNH